jgi:protein arginine kinase activator
MLCDNCLKHNATVHMTSFVNGQVKTVHLCAQCASKKKAAVVMPWFSFNDFLSTFYEESQVQDQQCEVCGTTLESFKKDGKLGCVNCYKVFEDSISPAIKGIHMSTTHTGKRPGEQVEVHPEKEKEEDVLFTRKVQLKAELKEAITIENFEEAARLRDEIALLDKEG